MTAKEWIERLELLPHPEGGFYKRTYRSEGVFAGDIDRDPFPAGRPWSTSIFYLMEAGDFSAFHRIKSDETWHFYAGGPMELYILKDPVHLETIRMGQGEQLQIVVPANHWFAAAPIEGANYCLMGCTLSPGFDFRDHDMARADELISLYPEQAHTIRRYCRH